MVAVLHCYLHTSGDTPRFPKVGPCPGCIIHPTWMHNSSLQGFVNNLPSALHSQNHASSLSVHHSKSWIPSVPDRAPPPPPFQLSSFSYDLNSLSSTTFKPQQLLHSHCNISQLTLFKVCFQLSEASTVLIHDSHLTQRSSCGGSVSGWPNQKSSQGAPPPSGGLPS